LPCVQLHFSRMIRRPRTSTLFPYTTLFRSRPERTRLTEEAQQRGVHLVGVSPQHPVRGALDLDVLGFRHPLGKWPPGGVDRQDADRKSTRLNSSHVKISYAVFCLKKKNSRQ